jgi:hypothetical protein
MPASYPPELAWRVVFRIPWLRQSIDHVTDERNGLAVSKHYVEDVMRRFEETGAVDTHQGQRTLTSIANQRSLTQVEDWKIAELIVRSPRLTLKEHRVQFLLETGVLVS